MITLLKMFALLWIAPLVQCQTGSTLSSPSTVQLPPLANVSLSWVTDFCYKLSWTPPVENQPCEYEVAEMNKPEVFLSDTLRYDYVAMQGGLLKFNLSAHCGGRTSAPVSTNLTFPELVKDFKCALHSRTSLNCTWRPAQQVADVHLYYWMGDRFGVTQRKENCSTTFDLVECPVYQTDANGSRTGCVLHHDLPCKSFIHRPTQPTQYGFSCRYVWFLFNSTVDGTLARNTFETTPSEHMQPPALTWTGEEDYDHNELTIRWTPVDLPGAWKYILDYTKCGKRVNEIMPPGSDHTVLTLDHCAFNITMKAKLDELKRTGESLPGPYRVYGKNTNPHTALILACTLIPGAVVVIVVMAFVCFRRHSESIFPQVPAPQDFLPEMLKNNNDKIHKAIYVPAPEEEPQNVRFDTKPESRSDMSS
ncbi:unnamed protein product [Arctogadus glacialis]